MSVNQEDQNIILGDAMLEITKLPNNSLDMIFTDPPYFIDRLDTTWNANEVVDSSKNKPNSHIKHLPKGMQDRRSLSSNARKHLSCHQI